MATPSVAVARGSHTTKSGIRLRSRPATRPPAPPSNLSDPLWTLMGPFPLPPDPLFAPFFRRFFHFIFGPPWPPRSPSNEGVATQKNPIQTHLRPDPTQIEQKVGVADPRGRTAAGENKGGRIGGVAYLRAAKMCG